MIQHAWTVLSRSVLVDRTSNNVSILEVLEQLGIARGPGAELPVGAVQIPAEMSAVTLWARSDLESPEQGFGKSEILRPTGEREVIAEYAIDLTTSSRGRFITRMMGFPFEGIGQYWLETFLRQGNDNWACVSRVPLQVEMAEQPATDRNGAA